MATKSNGKTILLVEDDSLYRNTVAYELKQSGFSVLHASNCQDAWLILEEKQVDLVITDIHMPNGNGMNLLRQIKDRNAIAPAVVLMTCHTDVDLSNAKDWGVEAVLIKPFDREELMLASQSAFTVMETEEKS